MDILAAYMSTISIDYLFVCDIVLVCVSAASRPAYLYLGHLTVVHLHTHYEPVCQMSVILVSVLILYLQKQILLYVFLFLMHMHRFQAPGLNLAYGILISFGWEDGFCRGTVPLTT